MGKQNSKLKPEQVRDLSNVTYFSTEELQEFYKSFLKEYPSGHVTVEQFKRIYSKHFPFGDSSMLAQQVFRNYDSNSDNKIDFRELVLGLSTTSRGTVNEKLEWAFQLYDKDHTGRISKESMLEIIQGIYRMMGPMLMVPEDESTPEKKTNKLFEALDRDGDGFVTWEDFRELARNSAYLGWLFECNPGEK